MAIRTTNLYLSYYYNMIKPFPINQINIGHKVNEHVTLLFNGIL